MVTTAVPGAEQRNLEVRVKVRDVVLLVHVQESAREAWISFKEPGSGWEAPSKTGTSYKASLHLCLIWPCEVMFPLKGPAKQYFVPK